MLENIPELNKEAWYVGEEPILSSQAVKGGTRYQVQFPGIELEGQDLLQFIAEGTGKDRPTDSAIGMAADLILPLENRFYKNEQTELERLHQNIPGWQEYVDNHNVAILTALEPYDPARDLEGMDYIEYPTLDWYLETKGRSPRMVDALLRMCFRTEQWLDEEQSTKVKLHKAVAQAPDEKLARFLDMLSFTTRAEREKPRIYKTHTGRTVPSLKLHRAGYGCRDDGEMIIINRTETASTMTRFVTLPPEEIFGPAAVYNPKTGTTLYHDQQGIRPMLAWTTDTQGKRTYDLGKQEGDWNTLIGLIGLGQADSRMSDAYPEKMGVAGREQKMAEAQAPLWYHLMAQKLVARNPEFFANVEEMFD